MKRRASLLISLLIVVTACGAPDVQNDVDDLPPASTTQIREAIQRAGTPAVVNVWASWCGPCRSEAPLLAAAAAEYRGDVLFIGLNVRDSQAGAKSFIADYLSAAPIDHMYDPDGTVVAELGGTSGVPLTFFVSADGTVANIHYGVIDERTLALEVDELARAASAAG